MVESYAVDDPKQESRFYYRIQFDYAICPRCRSVSQDTHDHKRRRVRGMSCFERKVYLVFDIRRFQYPSESGTHTLTEFNILLADAPPTIQLVNTLFAAELLGECARRGIKAANIWNWKNGYHPYDFFSYGEAFLVEHAAGLLLAFRQRSERAGRTFYGV